MNKNVDCYSLWWNLMDMGFLYWDFELWMVLLCSVFVIEDASFMFIICVRYNPYVQARSRIDQLKRLGHSVDKVGVWYFLIIIISVFSADRWFTRDLNDRLSSFWWEVLLCPCLLSTGISSYGTFMMLCLDTLLPMLKKQLLTLNIVQPNALAWLLKRELLELVILI